MARISSTTILTCLALCFGGCKAPDESEHIWEQIKIEDLAPTQRDKKTDAQLPKVMNFDVHIFEVPAENITKLNHIWQTLTISRLRFSNYDAFIANSFMIGLGRMNAWHKVKNVLTVAGSQKVLTVSIVLADGQTEDLTVIGLGTKRTISFISGESSLHKAVIGPGTIALRIKAAGISNVPNVCKLVAYPVFTVPVKTNIPKLADRTKEREFAFSPAAFGLKMNAGDFVLLGPAEYNSDTSTLTGLFFSKPEGSLFPTDVTGQTPKLKPAVRLFLLVCTGISD
jgi:hypothetical protein